MATGSFLFNFRLERAGEQIEISRLSQRILCCFLLVLASSSLRLSLEVGGKKKKKFWRWLSWWFLQHSCWWCRRCAGSIPGHWRSSLRGIWQWWRFAVGGHFGSRSQFLPSCAVSSAGSKTRAHVGMEGQIPKDIFQLSSQIASLSRSCCNWRWSGLHKPTQPNKQTNLSGYRCECKPSRVDPSMSFWSQNYHQARGGLLPFSTKRSLLHFSPSDRRVQQTVRIRAPSEYSLSSVSRDPSPAGTDSVRVSRLFTHVKADGDFH